MTDRERKMIEAYIPSPKDETLSFGEYYILDDHDRVQKVYIQDIMPGMIDESTKYGVKFCSTGKRYNGWKGYGNTDMSELYDNKEDCRNMTHCMYGDWEKLRWMEGEDD